MTDHNLQEQEAVHIVTFVNARTKPLFKSMLNQVGKNVVVGKSSVGYGDALELLDSEGFQSLFNQWITKCIEKDIMGKTTSTNSETQLEWRSDLSEVERAFLGMEVLKEML